MPDFTPWSALLGGALIGISASILFAFNGRVAGVSGIVGGLFRPKPGEASWRAFFVGGLLAGGLLLLALRPSSVGPTPAPLAVAIVAGLLVGFGARLGGGCTSGHGVCGVSRLSRRSLVATLTFMATGVATTLVARHVLGVVP